MDPPHQRPPAAGEAVDDREVPQRPVVVERALHGRRHDGIEVAVLGPDRPDVVPEVGAAGDRHPLRPAQAAAVVVEHLAEPRHPRQPVGHQGADRVEIRCGAVDHRRRPDGQRRPGSLELQEGHVDGV